MIETILITVQSGVPVLLTHVLTTLLVWFMAVTVYLKVTPYRELSLVKAGNNAAAVTVGTAYLALSIPLAFCLSGSLNLVDLLVWGALIVGVQILVFFAVDLKLQGFVERVKKGELAVALYVAAIKLSIAIILAAAITG